MKTKWMIGLMTLFFAGWSAGTARANFVLEDTGHLDVTTSHDTGVLWNSSTADVLTGGYIGNAYVNDDASLHVLKLQGISEASVGNLYAYDRSTVDISGAVDNSSHGTVANLTAYAQSTVNISGGRVDSYLYAYGSSTVNVSGGTVYNYFNAFASSLNAYDSSTVNVSSGSVSILNASATSTVNVSGGSVVNLRAYGSSVVNVSGGEVGNLYAYVYGSSLNAYDSSTVNVSSGSVGSLNAYNTSTVTLHGYDFRATGGLTLDGDNVLGTGVLTGRWFGPDNTLWTMTISGNAAGATILAIPEPATLTLLALGGLAMMRRGPGRKPKTPRKAR